MDLPYFLIRKRDVLNVELGVAIFEHSDDLLKAELLISDKGKLLSSILVEVGVNEIVNFETFSL